MRSITMMNVPIQYDYLFKTIYFLKISRAYCYIVKDAKPCHCISITWMMSRWPYNWVSIFPISFHYLIKRQKYSTGWYTCCTLALLAEICVKYCEVLSMRGFWPKILDILYVFLGVDVADLLVSCFSFIAFKKLNSWIL